jgi:hypothetical protein
MIYKQNNLHDELVESSEHITSFNQLISIGAETYRVIADAIINKNLTNSQQLWKDRKNFNQTLLNSTEKILHSDE